MKLFHFLPVVWSSFLVLWASQSEVFDDTMVLCQDDALSQLCVKNSSSFVDCMDKKMEDDTFTCLLYPKINFTSTNELNCSWSFNTLQMDEQLRVCVGICDETGQPPYCFNAEKVGSQILSYPESTEPEVEIQFKRSLRNIWTVYSYTYSIELLEVLAPPSNLSVSVEDGNLLVKWGLPQSRKNSGPQCFIYELDLGDQGGVKNLSQSLCYTELNIDPTYIYRVRIKTKRIDDCIESPMWSDWSPTVTVEQPVSKPNMMMIILISIGIPMILLTVLLVVRHLRVSELLFPPIPHPPRKYIHFLEKSDVFNFFQPTLSAKVEEEITQVQDTE